MAGEINWGILDPNAPAKIAGSVEQGRQNALAAQGAQQQQQMNALALKKAQLAMEDEQAAREAYAPYGGKAAVEIQGKAAEIQAKQLAQRKAQVEAGLSQINAMGQLVSGVRDQATYDQAKQQAASMFGEQAVANLPPVYSPEVVANLRSKALTVKDAAENEYKAVNQQLNAMQFKWKQQHDTAMLAETRRGHDITASKNQAEAAGIDTGFSPAAIENAAARYNIDGTLPPMGMGKAGVAVRAKILNRAAEIAAESGDTGEEQRISQIANKAISAALSKLQSQQTMVGAFERNFNKNADIVLEQSNKVDRSGIPLANKWIQAGKRSIAGDAQLSAYDASIKATANEYAKIVSGSMGNAAMAESEIKKVESLLNSAQTPQQVQAVITMMKNETQNRMKGFDEEKAALRASMRAKKSVSTPPAGATHGGKNPRTGQMEYFDAQGNRVK